ncbi:MAG TPA: ergothioneine biosynthesis protein EgtB [Gemmatimonadaceae bacterium]|nr:ergothioneine biosynthesis protein EgtB [Gemmatimonadaceae bacterium]
MPTSAIPSDTRAGAPGVAAPATRTRVAELLDQARARTLLLVHPLSERDATVQHDPLMSPIVWDLGHIAHFEELWLVRHLDGPVSFGEMPGIFNPFDHPRATRGALQLPSLDDTRALLDAVRARVLDRLACVDFASEHPLLRDGYVYRMVLQHEYQHGETMLQTLQLKTGAPYAPEHARALPAAPVAPATTWDGMARFDGGQVVVGTDDRSAAYDNERPAHVVRMSPFLIDRAPVRVGEYRAFMDDGGYERRALWTDAGWAWREESGARAPKYWERVGGEWQRRSFGALGALDDMHPVVHVCFHEAEAYARWAEKRLPTEMEWEVAAGWDAPLGRMRAFPWGDGPPTMEHANLDQLSFGTAPVGAYPLNVSPLGCYGMVGDVWEWTASDFLPYPGFEAFPYREYSEVFYGSDYKVLRGGSWATRPGAIRNSFRNWDYPMRRQIFSGFRCALDD